jgi:hypothetical protein
LEFSIIPDESVVTSCHLELALNGSNGTYKTDGASSIDSVNVQTYFNKIFLDFEIIGTNFYDMQGKTIIELFNSKRIRNLTLFTTDDTTNDQFHVHHS